MEFAGTVLLYASLIGQASLVELESLGLIALEHGRCSGDLCPSTARPCVLRVQPGGALVFFALEHCRDGCVQVQCHGVGDYDRRNCRAPLAGLGTGIAARQSSGYGSGRLVRVATCLWTWGQWSPAWVTAVLDWFRARDARETV